MSKNNILLRSKLKKAGTFLQQNDIPSAIRLYEQACQLDRGNAEFWSHLGWLNWRVGDLTQAESCSRKAVHLAPRMARAHHVLGMALHASQQFDEAITCYRHALRLQPDIMEAQYLLANALREHGDIDAAVEEYRRLLELDPDNFAGLNNYGALLTNLERSEEAIRILSHALELQADSVKTMHNLARAYVRIGAHKSAIEVLEKALRLRPGLIDAYPELANALRMDSRYDEALAVLDKALQLDPANRVALVGKARLYELLGRYAEAYAILDPLTQDSSASDALPEFFDLSRHFGQRDRAVSLIQQALARSDINRHAAAPLHLRLGRHYDRENNYDAAFKHFEEAKRISQRYCDLAAVASQFAAIRDTYSVDTVPHLPRSMKTSRTPIFIVGMPRSGTSLVEQIIASHPDIHGAGETDIVHLLGNKLSYMFASGAFPAFVNRLSIELLGTKADELLLSLSAADPSAARVTDKTPQHFIYIGLILQLFPNCSIIHCQRNPLDTCLSCWFSDFGSNYHNYTNDLDTLGRYYGLYAGLMKHWTTVFPDRIFQLTYEELVQDQETISRALLQHCDMEWSDRCLEFYKSDRVVNTISYDQVRQPMYNRSVNRWRNYDKYLGSLRAALDEAGVAY